MKNEDDDFDPMNPFAVAHDHPIAFLVLLAILIYFTITFFIPVAIQ